MNRSTNPSNPEAALIPRKSGSRPSLEWIHFAIEELTPFRFEPSETANNGTNSLFIKLSVDAKWKKREIGSYVGRTVTSQSINTSVSCVRDSSSPIITEADAVIEGLIRNEK